MTDWNIICTENYARDFKHYEKKQPNELAAVLNNLDTYFETLKQIGNPLQISAGFIHNEPDGIRALDQKGGKQKVKLQQTRLYIYPYVEIKQLVLLAIGNKTNQNEDIRNCRDIVKKIKTNRGL